MALVKNEVRDAPYCPMKYVCVKKISTCGHRFMHKICAYFRILSEICTTPTDLFCRRIPSDELCMAQRDCRSCTDHRCLWCGNDRCSLQACDGGISDIQSCPSMLLPSPPRPCSYVFDCFTCRELAHCRWQTVVGKDVCISLQDQGFDPDAIL